MNINLEEIKFRDVDFDQDVGFAYEIFKAGIMDSVCAYNDGHWPDEERRAFFEKGFKDPSMVMMTFEGEDIGYYSILEEEEQITLQRFYLLPGAQRQGIGKMVIEKAIAIAHEKEKVLWLEVLSNNQQAINAYIKSGFEVTKKVTSSAKGWASGEKEVAEMVHKATKGYKAPEGIPAWKPAKPPKKRLMQAAY